MLDRKLPERRVDWQSFTTREVDIANLLIEGRTTQEVAAELKIGSRCVYNYISTMKRKLLAETRSELLITLLNRGYPKPA